MIEAKIIPTNTFEILDSSPIQIVGKDIAYLVKENNYFFEKSHLYKTCRSTLK